MLYFLAGGECDCAIPALVHRTVVMIDDAIMFHHERLVGIERIVRLRRIDQSLPFPLFPIHQVVADRKGVVGGLRIGGIKR